MNLYGFSKPFVKENAIRFNAKTLGTMGEMTVAKEIQKTGASATLQRIGSRAGDVLVESDGNRRTIEVKTSMRGKDGSFQFCLKRELKSGRVCTDHLNADFVMLLCVEDDYSVVGFMIPSAILTQKKLTLTKPLECRWSNYLVWQ